MDGKKCIFIRWIHLYAENKECGNQTLLPGVLLMMLQGSMVRNIHQKPQSPNCDQDRCKIHHQPERTKLTGK